MRTKFFSVGTLFFASFFFSHLYFYANKVVIKTRNDRMTVDAVVQNSMLYFFRKEVGLTKFIPKDVLDNMKVSIK